jgi:hypothetical protein
MAIIQTAAASSGSAVVDPTFQAVRVSERPPEILGAYQTALVSGALTTVAAGGIVFSFRWNPSVATNLCMIRRVEIGVATTTAFTAAQSLQYSMTIARAFTSNDSGGLSASFANANTGKMRTSMPNSAFTTTGNIQIANTGTMTAVARTLDSFPMGYVATGGTAASPVPTIMPISPIYQHQAGDYPLILANNEGFVLLNTILMGAAGIIALTVTVEWMELSATSGNVISY